MNLIDGILNNTNVGSVANGVGSLAQRLLRYLLGYYG